MKLVNLRNGNVDRASVIRIDRTSLLGNPFEMRKESERAAVCEAFRRYLWLVAEKGYEPEQAAFRVAGEMQTPISKAWRKSSRSAFIRELNKVGHTSTIACWCAPKACHGQTIINYWDWIKKKSLS